MNNLAVVADSPRQPKDLRERVRELLEEVRAGRRLAGEDVLVEGLVERLQEDHAASEIAARFIIRSTLTAAATRERQRTNTPSIEERRRRQEATRAQAKAIAERVKEAAILDTEINGEPLRLIGPVPLPNSADGSPNWRRRPLRAADSMRSSAKKSQSRKRARCAIVTSNAVVRL
jgi:hypothetical protein